ncbi:uncharacterized protein LOC108160603 isoform X2 [Drosophila miranda]|uniref:uncharacterized protein LOC108160603 isoform X2 n=1 Tax=Drosophila miranda TaxID=7229 RepID=UPI0007E894A3|nr:uncharacterized protein LOC108160603 isoform X2 [Drosophila miranda]
MSSHDDIPGTSNGRKSRSKRRDKWHSRSRNSSSGTMPSPSGNFGRRPENRPSNGVNGSRMVDRVLVANAFAAEMSANESNSSPNSEYNVYGPLKLAKENNDKKHKKKNKKSKEDRKPTNAGLKGYSGTNPSLSYMQQGMLDDSEEETRDEAVISAGTAPVSRSGSSNPFSRKRPGSSIKTKDHDDLSKNKKRNRGPPPRLICADDDDPEEVMPPATTNRRKSVYSESGKRVKPNIIDELYRVPFKYGWTREVVIPSPSTNSSNHIFYTSPSGKKCRKISEIIPMLEGELTKENFLFGTHILGAEAQYETIRQALNREEHLAALKERHKTDKTKAKQKRRQTIGAESHSVLQAEAGTAAFGKRLKSIDDLLSMADESMTRLALEPVKILAAKVVEAPVMGKHVPKPKLPKGASSVPESWTATMAVKGNARLLAAAINGNARAAASSTVTSSSCAAPVRQETRETCGFCLKLIEGSVCQSCVQSAEGVDAVPLMGAYGELQDGEGESEKSYQAGTVSNGLDDIKVLEPPGEMPPAELLSTDTTPSPTPINLYTHQEVVVISGQKAISAVAEPAMTSQQKVLVPNPPDLTSYYEVYDKRIAAPKQSSPPDNPWEQMFGSGFNCRYLTSIMQTLNQQERANCSEVSKLWHLCSRDAEVWKSVSLRDTKVNNWPALVREMARNGTRDLDMMGAIIPTSGTLVAGDMRVLTDMRSLRTDHMKADFLHQIFRSLPQLEKLMCTCVSSGLNMTDIDKIENLKELRVRMTDTKASITGLPLVGKLTHLRALGLRGVKNLGSLLFLKDLPNLETLILGYCQSMHRLQLGNEVLPTHTKLQTFRIETDQRKKTLFPVDEIMRGLAQAGGVRRLELVNVDLDGNFSDLLSKCPTVEELLLIPKCQTNSALMMRAVMDISKNGNQLKLFKLVLVTQLLTATSALVGNPDVPMVPVVRPVPGIPLNDPLNICSDECHQQGHSMCVAVLPFERLKVIMAEMMPYSSLSVVTTAMVDTPSIQLERLPPDAAVPTPIMILNF